MGVMVYSLKLASAGFCPSTVVFKARAESLGFRKLKVWDLKLRTGALKLRFGT